MMKKPEPSDMTSLQTLHRPCIEFLQYRGSLSNYTVTAGLKPAALVVVPHLLATVKIAVDLLA